jgi:ribosomal RNA-processing protein 8
MVGGGKGEGWVVEADFLSSVPLPGRSGGGSGSSKEKESGKSKGKKGRKSKAEEAEASEIVDVVVCCLSLMGINWIGGIYEACRIMRPGQVCPKPCLCLADNPEEHST